VTPLNQIMDEKGQIKAGDDQLVFGKYNFLQPQDSRQYLFCLTPRSDLKTNYKQLRGATNIGTHLLFNRECFIQRAALMIQRTLCAALMIESYIVAITLYFCKNS
jgi:hypothetical protein